jgi:retinol-binding protein 3
VRINSLVVALLGLLPAIALADGSGPRVPATPAGHALAAWLEAFNGGDRGRINAFDEAHVPWMTLDRAMGLRARTGGYELLSVDKSDRLWLIFSAQEKADSRAVIGRLVVTSDNPWLAVHSDEPSVISWLSLDPLAPGTKGQETTIDAAERKRVIEGAARLLDELYVFPNVGKRMSAALRSAQKRGTYRSINDGSILAWRLSDDLWDIAHDGHIGVRFSQAILPAEQTGHRPDTDSAAGQRLLARNCGFEKAEHLPPNIGYLKFDEFADAEVCARTAAAAMNFIADSDVLIIDLRDNHGGGGLRQFVASYLFAEPTHLNDIYSRGENATSEDWTLPYVPGKKFIGKPVFVLTSKQTFSAAEDFCYALKNLKRATLIGETTGGGAHPAASHRIDDHFSIKVPFARSISPITHTDWEGVGVEPDVKVPATDALDEALKRARSGS